jgi:hypothetical protein
MTGSLLTVLCLLAPLAEAPTERPRLIVLTDIGSLEAGVAEPDDGQSMIRLMLYANELDIEAFVASSNLGHGQRVRPDLIGRVVDAYGAVQPNLARHDARYPTPGVLRERIKGGQAVAGPKVPVSDSVGRGKDTDGSDAIIRVVDRPDPRPVWVVIWGGSADLAQALWTVRSERTPAQLERFLASLRIYAINDQDSTGPWIRANFPGLYYMKAERCYRGMYRGGDTRLTSSAWVQKHIHGHGALGDLYPDYNGGDIWTGTLGRVRGIKEGDTPSFLWLVPNGLGDLARPELGSWGGRFERRGKSGTLVDVADTDLDTTGDPDPRMATVYRWREAYQNDFAARLDWCVRPFDATNHPPIVRIGGERERTITPGSEVRLDAGDTSDPDGNRLSFAWSIYPKLPGAEAIAIENHDTKQARLRVPPAYAGRSIPVLLTVTDNGQPRLTRYRRVLLNLNSPR